MDDEEYAYAALGEPLYRVETGNYEYRYKIPRLLNVLTNYHFGLQFKTTSFFSVFKYF